MRTLSSIKLVGLGITVLVSVSVHSAAAQVVPQSLESLYFANETTGWAAGDDGVILSTTNAGRTWTRQQSGTTDALSSVHFANESTGWAVGSQGVILSTPLDKLILDLDSSVSETHGEQQGSAYNGIQQVTRSTAETGNQR